MKILIVTDGFFPEISARSLRATELAKELARQGHNVKVISKERQFNVRAFEHDYNLEYGSFGKLRLPEIKQKGGKLELLLRRIVNRLLVLLFEYPLIEIMLRVKNALKNELGYDLLISIAAPHPIHWGVAWGNNKHNIVAAKWIADCGDPYMGERADTFRKMPYFKYLEKWFCRKADYISVPINDAISAYYPEFRHKIFVIPQGFDFSNIKLADYHKNSDYPIFAFAGSLTMYIDTAPPFFSYLLSVASHFKFILYVETLGWAEEFVLKLGSKIEVRKYIPREQLVYELSRMDFLVNFMYKTNVQRSSKLINYALSCRPILCIDVENDFKQTFQEFISGDYHQQYPVRDIDDFNISKVAKQFVDLSLRGQE